MIDALNDRELAVLVWLGLGSVLLFTQAEGRASLQAILRAFFHPYVLAPVVGLGLWVTFLAWMFTLVGLWSPDLTGPLMVWALTVGIGMLMDVGKTNRPGWWRGQVRKAFALTAFAEALTNLVVFGFLVELVLVPVLTVLVLMAAVSAGDRRLAPARTLVEAILAIAGVGLLGFVLVQLFSNLSGLDDAARTFVLPFWLTLGSLPFVYLVGVWSGYQVAFNFLRGEARGRALWRGRFALLTGLGANARTANQFRTYEATQLAEATTWGEARGVVAKHRAGLRDEPEAGRQASRRILKLAGVIGTDDGRQLDRREFAETKSALLWIATAQDGWYSNPEQRYREDLLSVLEPLRGLPANHGVTMHVANDGQSWWAWRRTVTGWCFAVGSAAPPPDQWLHDGPDPPTGFPGQDPAWGEQWGLDAVNWSGESDSSPDSLAA